MARKKTAKTAQAPAQTVLQIETVLISDLLPDPGNVRRHGEKNLAAVKASLKKFGQQTPIVINHENIILAGNARYEAAKALGWETIAVVRSDLTGTEAAAFAIADNRTGELAEWNETGLAETLRALQSEDFDIENIGYRDEDLQNLLRKLGNDAIENGQPPESSTKEIDPDGFNMECVCPKCGFEFDPKT